MLEVRSNYSGSHSDTKCPLCEVDQDTQKYLLVCKKLNDENNIVSEVPKYENLFSQELKPKILISRIIQKNFTKRKKMLKKEKN